MSKQSIRFVKYPTLMSSLIWEEDATFKLYCFLLYKAMPKEQRKTTRKEQCGDGFMLNSYELVISRQTASKQLRWSIHKYQRHLHTLEDLGVIVTQRVRMRTKIQIVDFLSVDGTFNLGKEKTEADLDVYETEYGESVEDSDDERKTWSEDEPIGVEGVAAGECGDPAIQEQLPFEPKMTILKIFLI